MSEAKNILREKMQGRLKNKAPEPIKNEEKKEKQPPSPVRANTRPKIIEQEMPSSNRVAPGQKKKLTTEDRTQLPPAKSRDSQPDFTQQLEQLISQQEKQHTQLAKDEEQFAEESIADRPAPKQPMRRPKKLKIKAPREPGYLMVRLKLFMENINAIRLCYFYLIAAAIVVIDQITKLYAKTELINGPVEILPWLEFFLVFNPGAAFSLFADSGWQRPFLVGISAIVSIVLILWLPRIPPGNRLLSLSVCFILGGAVGNLIDRMLFGHVVDFISLHYQQLRFPTFNIADTAITIGAGLLLLDMIMSSKKNKKPLETDSENSQPDNNEEIELSDTQPLKRKKGETVDDFIKRLDSQSQQPR